MAGRSKLVGAGEYGSDVVWHAHEVDAFLAFNRLAREQAIAIFNWSRNPVGAAPATAPALELAARARAMASA